MLKEMDELITPGKSDDDGELLETVPLVMSMNSLCLDRVTEPECWHRRLS